eukprot:COSAG02_NODE_62851_length_264_cov_2.169697_1_plen_44_part_10
MQLDVLDPQVLPILAFAFRKPQLYVAKFTASPCPQAHSCYWSYS